MPDAPIYGNNRINYMAFFSNTCCAFARLVIRAVFACGWHVFYRFIRSRCHRQIRTLMFVLTADLFPGWFPQTFRCRLLKTITGRWLGTVFGILVKLFFQFLDGLIELGNQLCLGINSII